MNDFDKALLEDMKRLNELVAPVYDTLVAAIPELCRQYLIQVAKLLEESKDARR